MIKEVGFIHERVKVFSVWHDNNNYAEWYLVKIVAKSVLSPDAYKRKMSGVAWLKSMVEKKNCRKTVGFFENIGSACLLR